MTQQYAIIATPSYDGRIEDLCAGSIAAARVDCLHHHVYAEWITMSGSPYLQVLRNKLVRDFLNTPQATDLVFIDADVGFDPAALARILSYDADIVGGCYPFKSDSGGFPVMIDWKEQGVPRVRGVRRMNGRGEPLEGTHALPECLMLPTGFLRIRRNVFERYLEHFGEENLTVIERDPDTGAERERYCNIFSMPQTGERWWGEDTWFCKQVREELGFTLLLDPDIDFTHTGRKHWHGNYHTHRRMLPGGDLHVPDQADKLRKIAAEARAILEPMDRLAELAAGGEPAQGDYELNGVTHEEFEKLREQNKLRSMTPPLEELPRNEFMNLVEDEPRMDWETGKPERRELLIGCGHSRFKVMVPPGGSPAWHELTTLDRNPDVNPDVQYDLENPGDLPFADDTFAEIHAYEVLEHVGAQGDWQAFFRQFAEFWRILRPGGYVIGTVPAWDSEAAWGDVSHRRVLPPMAFGALSQAEYRRQAGLTMMSDFRFFYKADFDIVHLAMDETRYQVDHTSGRVRKIEPPQGRFTRFMLRAVKPSTYTDADMEIAAGHQEARRMEYEQRIAAWENTRLREHVPA